MIIIGAVRHTYDAFTSQELIVIIIIKVICKGQD